MGHAERFLPDADGSVSEHTLVGADAGRTSAALASAGVSADRILGLLGGLADLPERLSGVKSPSRTLGELLGPEFGFVPLADEPGSARVVGLVLRYSAFERRVERLGPEQFASFDAPGHLKLVVAFSLQPQDDGRTLVGCEMRVRGTDEDTRSTLRTTWFAVGAGLRLLARRLLEVVRAEAEGSSRAEHAEDGDAHRDHDDADNLRAR